MFHTIVFCQTGVPVIRGIFSSELGDFNKHFAKEDYMAKKRGKAVSFDAMVKFFMRNYDIPTKQDVEKLIEKMDRIENLIRATSDGSLRNLNRKAARGKNKTAGRSPVRTASDQVLETIKRFREGVGFADIQARSGFGDKKLRNIIFRLNKLGKIKRKSRGIYIAT
jgi:hypothetical protein